MANELRSIKSSVNKQEGNEKTERLVKLLTEEEAPQFELPYFMSWPTGKRSFSDRAIMLMLAGIQYLDETYKPKQKEATPTTEETARGVVGATAVDPEEKKEQPASAELKGWG